MNWDFAKRTGDLAISKFERSNFGTDGLTFTGPMCAPGVTSCGKLGQWTRRTAIISAGPSRFGISELP